VAGESPFAGYATASVHWPLSARVHRRVRPEPDRALYRGDFLAQSRVHDEGRFELALVLRNRSGPICPTAATDSRARRPSADGRRPNQLLDGSCTWGWPILHQEHLHVGKAPPGTTSAHTSVLHMLDCPTSRSSSRLPPNPSNALPGHWHWELGPFISSCSFCRSCVRCSVLNSRCNSSRARATMW
jgi:hypothetical protein